MRKPIPFPAFTARLTSITVILNCTFAGQLFKIGCLWPVLLLSAAQGRAQTEYADLGQYQRQFQSARSDQQKASALLSIGFHFLSKPGERHNDMKAAKAYGEAARRIATRVGSDSLQARALLLSSQILKESGKRAEALAALNQAIARYGASGDLAGEGTALMEKRHYYQLSGPEMDERIRVVSRAAQLFKRAGDQRLRGDALLELGDVVGNDGKLMEAIDYLKQADIAYRQAGFPRTQYLYSTLCIAHTALGSYQEGLEYGFKAEKVARSLGDSSQTLTAIYNRIGMTYYNLEDELNALEFFKKGLAVAVKNNDEDGMLYLTGNVMNILLLRKRGIAKSMLPELDSIVTRGSAKSFKPIPCSEICRIYLHVGNTGRAKFFLDQLLEFQKSKPLSPSEEMPVYRAAYEYYYYLKDFRAARQSLDQEAVLAHRSLDTRRLQGIYQSRYKLDSIDGNYKSAFENLKKFKTYTDSTAANKARNELQSLTVRYQLEMKNDEIKLKSDNIRLLTKDNDAQKALLHRADVIRNITIAAIVLLIMLLAALYSRWTANRRNSIIIANKNQRLEQLVREKEWLVKEIHHRVKNNLQTIISLLETQAAFLRDDALSAVLDSQHRIHAMSLIHQKLYLVDTSTSIDMRPYVEELVHYLADSFDPNAKIEIALDVDHVLLDVSRAIPVGLIVNEAVTNAMKYAYPNRETGLLQVSLKQSPGKRIELRIQDDGIGMPPTMDNVRPSSLGMRLMKGLANEISGELSIESRHGTAVSLTFPLSEPIVTTPEHAV